MTPPRSVGRGQDGVRGRASKNEVGNSRSTLFRISRGAAALALHGFERALTIELGRVRMTKVDARWLLYE